jgi:hypothetical protein
MGTSNRSGGPGSGTPLVPSFLIDEPTQAPVTPPSDQPPDETSAAPTSPAQSLPPLPPPSATPTRFQSARRAFTRFAKTRDTSTLRRSLSDYVSKGTGGRGGATQRMGSARRTAASFAGLIQAVQTAGAPAALRSVGLDHCIGRNAGEVFVEILEVICPDGGRIDEGLAREAFERSIVECIREEIPIEDLSIEQWGQLLINFLALSIQLRVIADIGQSALEVPADINQALAAEAIMKSVIYATVNEQIGNILERTASIPADRLREVTDDAYERAWGAFEDFVGDGR